MAAADTNTDHVNVVRRACVDIGSKTTRLLVADVEDGELTEVRAERAFTKLAPGQALSHRKCREVAELVAGQVARARTDGATSIRVLGTAAIRGAPDGPRLCSAISAACGIDVEVLSGEQEAELAFLGATCGLAQRPTG